LTPDEWLAANTFWCPHLKARITPTQCDLNRKRPDPTDTGESFSGFVNYIREACRECQDHTWLKSMVGKTKEEVESHMPNKLIDCLGPCGRQDVENCGRGLCSTCYPQMSSKDLKKFNLVDARAKREKRLARKARHEEESQPEPSKSGNENQKSSHQIATKPQQPSNTNDNQDPLASAQFVNLRGFTGTHPVTQPKMRVSPNKKNCTFTATALELFPADRFDVYQHNGHVLLHTHDQGQLTLSTMKQSKSKSCSAKAMVRAFGWQGGEVFRVEATSRPDVVQLVQEQA